MWYQSTVTAAASELVTAAEAMAHCRVDAGDSVIDAEIDRLIAAARRHVENYCSIRIGSQTLVSRCDSFADFERLPEAPITSVSVQYVDTAGATQTLATDVYELRNDGLEAAIALAYGKAWPAIQPGSRITVTIVGGFTALAADLRHAMLMLIAHWFANREAVSASGAQGEMPMGVADLLANNRR